jgi:hypothetical protein
VSHLSATTNGRRASFVYLDLNLLNKPSSSADICARGLVRRPLYNFRSYKSWLSSDVQQALADAEADLTKLRARKRSVKTICFCLVRPFHLTVCDSFSFKKKKPRFSIRIERNCENSSFACAGRRQSMSALLLAVGLLSRSIVVVSSRRCNVMPTTDNIVGTLSASRCRHDYHNISIAASFCLCCRRRSSPPISTTSARWQSILPFAANSPRRSSNSARSTATTRSLNISSFCKCFKHFGKATQSGDPSDSRRVLSALRASATSASAAPTSSNLS